MSIVKQIVDLSGGRIDVRSDQWTGTEVKLSLPLDNCLPESVLTPVDEQAIADTEEDPIDAVRRRAAGRSIHIQGFNSVPGRSSVQKEALASLKASMIKYSTQWLHLNLVSSHEDADIAISDETAYLDTTLKLHKQKILLILCNNKGRRKLYPTRADNGQIVEFVSKPCGPHRLAKALLNCLDTEDAMPRATQRTRVSAPVTTRPDVRGDTRRGSHSLVPDDTTATAGSSNTRLIGDLQSSIGFTPAVISQIRYTGPQKTFDADLIRPGLVSRQNSSSSGSRQASQSSSKEAASAVDVSIPLPSPREADEIIMRIDSPAKEGGLLHEPPRQPKMLLVEVRVLLARPSL